MAHFLPENLEQILIRLSVKDLIRCKSVCKSWLSLISDHNFIKSHLNHCYLNDRNNEEIGHRRITMCKNTSYFMCQHYDIEYDFFDLNDHHLLGSSNGLVCVSPSPTEILVINPSTRQVNKVTKPQIPKTDSLCWGFGYDSSIDDYKIVLGFWKGKNCTCFQVFSLRSNIWKIIGEINHVFLSSMGVLCKGALHWVAYDESSRKDIILSFLLSTEKFGEVPQPDDVRYQLIVGQIQPMRLGTLEDSLCVFQLLLLPHEVWVMKDYNNKQSWEIFGSEREIKNDVVHDMKLLRNYIPNKRPLCHGTWVCQNRVFLGAHLYVESLVSPHFHKTLKRKSQVMSTIKSRKVGSNHGHANANASASSSASTSARV